MQGNWKQTFGLLLLLEFGALAGCSNTSNAALEAPPEVATGEAPQSASPAGILSGTVLETMNSGGYTYVQVDLGTEKLWAAGPETSLKVGDTVHFSSGMPMHDFHSKTLDRTFDVVYFVDSLQTEAPTGLPKPISAHQSGATGGPPVAASEMDFSGIQKPQGGHAVEELYVQRDKLSGKEVLLRGRVVKFNGGIMGKNWLHIQDGSGSGDTADVTVTTQDTADVGSLVLVRGTVVLDKDFGFGYNYSLMIEEATVTVE